MVYRSEVSFSLELPRTRQFAQRCDPILERRVGAKPGGKGSSAEEGLDDAERACRWRNPRRRNAIVVRAQFLQCADEAIRMTHHVRAGFVCTVFSLARKAKLQKCGAERSEEDQK